MIKVQNFLNKVSLYSKNMEFVQMKIYIKNLKVRMKKSFRKIMGARKKIKAFIVKILIKLLRKVKIIIILIISEC